jgi:hypothetical protein
MHVKRGDVVRVMLKNFIKEKLSSLTPEQLHLSDATVEFRSEGTNWCHVAIKGPHDGLPRVFEVRITEKI